MFAERRYFAVNMLDPAVSVPSSKIISEANNSADAVEDVNLNALASVAAIVVADETA